MKVIDLFSGLGGFSQAFVDRGHAVTRYDLDPQFKAVPHTVLADVLNLTADDLKGADIILASPPCTHFSIAAVYRHWPKGIPTEETLQQIELVKHTINIIEEANPTYWLLENPVGKLRTVIGKPAITQYWGCWGDNVLKPTDLWGKYPPVDWRPRSTATYEKAPRGSKKGVQGINLASFKKNPHSYIKPRDPALRALIPYDFSLAVCLAAEGKSMQTTLDKFTTLGVDE